MSKCRVEGLGTSYVIGLFRLLALLLLLFPIPINQSSHLITSEEIRSGIGRKRRRSVPCDFNSVELTIAINFFIHTGGERSLRF